MVKRRSQTPTVKTLRQQAKAKKIKGYWKMRKVDLLKALGQGGQAKQVKSGKLPVVSSKAAKSLATKSGQESATGRAMAKGRLVRAAKKAVRDARSKIPNADKQELRRAAAKAMKRELMAIKEGKPEKRGKRGNPNFSKRDYSLQDVGGGKSLVLVDGGDRVLGSTQRRKDGRFDVVPTGVGRPISTVGSRREGAKALQREMFVGLPTKQGRAQATSNATGKSQNRTTEKRGNVTPTKKADRDELEKLKSQASSAAKQLVESYNNPKIKAYQEKAEQIRKKRARQSKKAASKPTPFRANPNDPPAVRRMKAGLHFSEQRLASGKDDSGQVLSSSQKAALKRQITRQKKLLGVIKDKRRKPVPKIAGRPQPDNVRGISID